MMLPGPPPTPGEAGNKHENKCTHVVEHVVSSPGRETDILILDRAGSGTEWVSEEVMFQL